MFQVTDSGRMRRAERKAREARPNVSVLGYGTYEVDGRHGPYVVEIQLVGDATEVHCQCLAGENGQPCYHAAAALSVHARQVPPAPPAPRDRNLALVEGDLKALRAGIGEIEGNYELVDMLFARVRAALSSLADYELSLEPACEELPRGVREPRAA